MKQVKTNAVRLIEQAGIPFELREYEFDENDLSGEHAADSIGLPREQVFKTLVTRGAGGGLYVFCLPVCDELDLKKAAASVGEKSVAMIHVKELLPLTGYIRGGCSPVGMKKALPTHIDETAVLFDRIAVSAGQRGCQMIVPPEELAAFVGAEFADIVR